MGRCLPVNTLASLIGAGSGRVTDDNVTELIRSSTEVGVVVDMRLLGGSRLVW
ncbi:hypothetical protein GCM10009634_82780 [Saccharothrix xinjiangensis]